MNSASRFTAGFSALLLGFSGALAETAPSADSPRIEDDATYANWVPVRPIETEDDVYEVDVGRVFAPERVREIRIWVDTVGLFRFDDANDDGDATAAKDFISFEELRKQDVFKGLDDDPNTTALGREDNGEVFIFRESDRSKDFNLIKSAIIDGKFKVRVSPSTPGEYSLGRVHVTVHFRPSKRPIARR